jgi:hypothetical protein
MLCDPVHAVPHCLRCATVFYAVGYTLCSSSAVSSVLCSVSTVLCMSIPPCRRRRLVKVMHGRPRARPGARYQCLPTPQTKPKTMWSCMWNPLPNLTKIRARGANQLGVFGLVRGPLTRCYQSTVLAVDQYKIVLPIITGRGVKYTQ